MFVYAGLTEQGDPMTNSWTASAADEPEPSASPPRQHQRQQQQQQQPVMPDAVINMAAKVGSDKKPFAYIADVNDIRQQRDRVRRKYARLLIRILRILKSFTNSRSPGYWGCGVQKRILSNYKKIV